ncbi:hypothetical protein [Kitasatospora sp. NPDC085464]|uniref:hypothetical protein n=1 Tax=Kitasatospora sp. NPDC085464 TaxID=3364063 RepID=UPI0037CB4506
MDSGIGTVIEAVRAARTKIREDALPMARESGREPVPAAEEATLLRAIAELLDTVGELVDSTAGRLTTGATRTTYMVARRRIRDEANNLKGDAEVAAARVK